MKKEGFSIKKALMKGVIFGMIGSPLSFIYAGCVNAPKKSNDNSGANTQVRTAREDVDYRPVHLEYIDKSLSARDETSYGSRNLDYEARGLSARDRGSQVARDLEEAVEVEEIVEKVDKISVPYKGLIVLDPGHGFDNNQRNVSDSGAVARRYKESEIVLGQAKKIRSILEKKGYEVILTREDETTPTRLRSRLPLAKKLNADLLVSLHCNGSDNPNAQGIETWYEGKKEGTNYKIANIVHESLVNCVSINGEIIVGDRGVKTKKLAVLDPKFPSILVESGFITNSADRVHLTDRVPDVEYGIAEGIDKYMCSRSK